MCSKRNLSKCWEPLKLTLLQRSGETYTGANVTKVERKCEIAYGQILSASKWAISSQAPNRSGSNDYPGSGSRGKRLEMISIRKDEDIVCASWKHGGAHDAPVWCSEPFLFELNPSIDWRCCSWEHLSI